MELTVYYGATLDQMTPVLNAFQAKYPDVKLKSYRAANEELAATMEMETRSGNPQFDVVVQGNGPVITLQGKYGCFEPFTCASNEAVAESLRDPDGIMTPVGTGFYVIIYNTNLVGAEEAPASFKDLMDPKWENAITLADPTSSSSVYTLIWMMTQYLDQETYGWNFFEKMQELNANYVASHGTIGELVSMGERKVGIQVMATAGTSLKKGDHRDRLSGGRHAQRGQRGGHSQGYPQPGSGGFVCGLPAFRRGAKDGGGKSGMDSCANRPEGLRAGRRYPAF